MEFSSFSVDGVWFGWVVVLIKHHMSDVHMHASYI